MKKVLTVTLLLVAMVMMGAFSVGCGDEDPPTVNVYPSGDDDDNNDTSDDDDNDDTTDDDDNDNDDDTTDDRATVCANAVDEEGEFVPAPIYLDDGEFNTCKTVDPNIGHLLAGGAVEGYEVPSSINIPAGELEDGESRAYTIVYYQDPRTVVVSTLDQFGNAVSGDIFFNGLLKGTGQAEIQFNGSTEGEISFGSLEGFTTPAPVSTVGLEDGSVFDATYVRPGQVASVCFNVRNPLGEMVNVPVYIDGVTADGNCRAIDVDQDHVITVNWDAIPGFEAPRPFRIAKNALTDGAERIFDLFFVEYDSNHVIYGKTLGQVGEMFLDGVSVGWNTTEDFAEFWAPKDGATVTFADVPGSTTPAPIFIGYDSDHAFGLYDAETRAALCVRGENDWGYSAEASATLDDVETLTWMYYGFDCASVNPNEDHVVTWNASQYDYNEEVIVPDAQTVTADELEAGQFFYLVGIYMEQQDPQEVRKEVYVTFVDPSGDPMHANFQVTDQYDTYNNDSYDDYRNLGEGDWVTIEPFDVAYLLAPAPITIRFEDLNEGMDEYNAEEGVWEFVFQYVTSEPSTRICVSAENGNGVQIDPRATFDGLDPLTWYWQDGSDDEACQYLPNSMGHVVAFYGMSGMESPRDIYIPATVLNGGSKDFNVLFIPSPQVATVAISTDEVAEVFMNGRSVGWSEDGYSAQVLIDRSQTNVISFGQVAGHVTPAPVTIEANSLDNWGYQEVYGYYN